MGHCDHCFTFLSERKKSSPSGSGVKNYTSGACLGRQPPPPEERGLTLLQKRPATNTMQASPEMEPLVPAPDATVKEPERVLGTMSGSVFGALGNSEGGNEFFGAGLGAF